MDTKVFKIYSDNPDYSQIKDAANILRQGGLLAFPTETVYGLGADATDPTAAKRIYAAKGRPSDNPLIVHISDYSMLKDLTIGENNRAKRLADRFWPGPLTMILPKSQMIPCETTGGLDTVAIRLPSRMVARLIIEEAGIPIAAPSANISGRPSPTRAAHVIEDFMGRIEGIVDDGPSPIGVESTIIDITGDTPVLLRRGFITKSELEEALGENVEDTFGSPDPEKPKAPGMKYRHYAPKGELYIVSKSEPFASVFELASESAKNGKPVAILTTDEHKEAYSFLSPKGIKIFSLGARSDGRTIMQNLYAVLRKLDEEGIETAYSEGFFDVEYGDTIMERLIRASGGKVIE